MRACSPVVSELHLRACAASQDPLLRKKTLSSRLTTPSVLTANRRDRSPSHRQATMLSKSSGSSAPGTLDCRKERHPYRRWALTGLPEARRPKDPATRRVRDGIDLHQ